MNNQGSYNSNVQQQQVLAASANANNYGQQLPAGPKQPAKMHHIRKGSSQAQQPLPLQQNSGSAGGPGNMPLFDDVESNNSLWIQHQQQKQQQDESNHYTTATDNAK